MVSFRFNFHLLGNRNKMFRGKRLTDMSKYSFTSPPTELLNVEPGIDQAVLFQVYKYVAFLKKMMCVFKPLYKIGSFK